MTASKRVFPKLLVVSPIPFVVSLSNHERALRQAQGERLGPSLQTPSKTLHPSPPVSLSPLAGERGRGFLFWGTSPKPLARGAVPPLDSPGGSVSS